MKQKNYLWDFFKYIKYAKEQYMLGIALLIIALLTELYSVRIITKMFSDEMAKLDLNVVYKVAIKFALFYLILNIIQAIALAFRKYFLIKGATIVYNNIQQKVYNHVQFLPIKYFDDIPVGTVLSRVMSDVRSLRQFFEEVLVNAGVSIIKILTIFVILLVVDYKLAIVMLIIYPLLFLIQKYNKDFISTTVYEYIGKFSKSSAHINEVFTNQEIINAFNNEEKALEEWKEIINQRRTIGEKINIFFSFFSFTLFDLFSLFTKILIIAYYFFTKNISLDNTLIFLFYVGLILQEMGNITFNISNYSQSVAASKKLSELLDLEAEKFDNLEIIENFVPNIKFENVDFGYKEELVLKNINLDIKENESVAFVGHTGSGKSTIMNLLIKFYQINSGKLLVSGKSINEIDTNFLRNNISIVLQDPFLFEGSILSNICDDEEKAMEVLKLIGADFIIKERGIHAKVLTGGSNFSVGEKQLISFARALARDPKILILDEASSNIDSKMEQLIQKGIEVLKKNRTTLIIAHRLSTIKNVDCIYVLNKGEIIEKGNHEDLIKLDGTYKEMVNNDLIHEV